MEATPVGPIEGRGPTQNGDALPEERDRHAAIVAGIPVAVAIAIFGTFFGAAANPLLGPELTIAASALIFSGALQLSLIGLLLAGAAAPALLATAVVLNLRNILLGAVLRPHVVVSLPRRLGLSWFILDETVGLALARPLRARSTLVTTGLMAYGGWIAGTLVGVVGGAVGELQPLAAAMFPVLFIGLASLAASDRAGVIRVAVAGALTIALSLLLPVGRDLAPVAAAVLVALPGRAA